MGLGRWRRGRRRRDGGKIVVEGTTGARFGQPFSATDRRDLRGLSRAETCLRGRRRVAPNAIENDGPRETTCRRPSPRETTTRRLVAARRPKSAGFVGTFAWLGACNLGARRHVAA